MQQEIEIEYKNLLTKTEFQHLLTNLPFPSTAKKQINYYFETKELSLQKNQAALRIREKNNNYVLTLKEPHSEGILETHDYLTEKEAISWINGEIIEKKNTSKQLRKLQIKPSSLIYQGSLTTERREIDYQDILLVLDYSTYNNHEDYELELEAPNRALGWDRFSTILADHQIEIRKTKNKIERFFSTI